MLSKILDSLGDGLICFDDQYRCTYVDANAQCLFGQPASALVGRPCQEICPHAGVCPRSERPQQPISQSELYVPALSSWYECVFHCLPSGCSIYFRNITQSKRIEKELRESQERSALAQRAGKVGVFDLDMLKGTVFWTPQLEELYGFATGTFEGTREAWGRLLITEDRQRIDSALEVSIQERQQETAYEYQFRHQNGQMRWMSTRARVIYDEAGQAVRMIGTCQDVTDAKQAEQALRESEQRFRTMGEALPYGVWWCDAEGQPEYFSQSFLDLLGMTMAEVRTGQWVRRFHPDDAGPTIEAWRETVRTGRDWDTEYRILGPDGRYHTVLCRGKPIRHNGNGIVGWVGIHLNIDDRKEMENKLRRNQQELRAMAATLERRVLQRTHDLEEKTHRLRRLAATLSNAERLERERLAGAIHDHLQQILVAARMRVQLAKQGKPQARSDSLTKAGDLLEEALRATRSLTTELRPPVLYEDGLIAALQWLAGRMSEQFGLEVELELNAEAEPKSVELRAILFESARELLFNVSKHAGVSRVHVELSRSEHNEILLAVEDEGVGFPESRVEDAGGVGLFRIRERMIALGGQADIDSVPGHGARILLILPEEEQPLPKSEPVIFERPAELPRFGVSAAVPSGLIRVIVADDHRMVREGLVMVLESQPDISVVAQAGDGLEAVELARQIRPDVVVMDINMPKMNGIEATRVIRRELPETVVIGVSAYGESGTEDSMKSAGAVEYLDKGGEPERLVLAVRQHATERVGSPGSAW